MTSLHDFCDARIVLASQVSCGYVFLVRYAQIWEYTFVVLDESISNKLSSKFRQFGDSQFMRHLMNEPLAEVSFENSYFDSANDRVYIFLRQRVGNSVNVRLLAIDCNEKSLQCVY